MVICCCLKLSRHEMTGGARWYGVPFIGDKWKGPGLGYILKMEPFVGLFFVCGYQAWISAQKIETDWEDRGNEKCCFPEKLETTIKTLRYGCAGPNVRVWSEEAQSWGSSAQRLSLGVGQLGRLGETLRRWPSCK